jgi:hypothetical protein
MRILTKSARAVVAAGALLLAGCGDYLKVTNPEVIDQAVLDPVAEANLFSKSVQQNFASAYGWLIMYSSWFTGETDVSETFPTRNEFGRRAISVRNGSLDTDVWFPLSQVMAEGYRLLEASLPDPTSNIDYARVNLFMGFGYTLMAEMFCRGTVRAGPELSTAAMLDSAVAHFNLAVSRGTANGTSAGLSFARAANVGLARAYLQAGNATAAVAAANAVPAGFVFNLNYVDDLANRTRLANRLFQFVRDRGSIAVPPIWRTTDTRLPWALGSSFSPAFSPQDANYRNDRGVPYAVQRKYPDYNSPIRLASKLEADYIVAETQGTAAQLVLINARRAAGGQPAYSGPTDAASVLTEFFTQRGFDFYLEGKRLGDFRRAPGSIVGVPVAGSTYWKAGFAPVGSDVCFPLPITETDNNPNL